jgi:hypothetical protein
MFFSRKRAILYLTKEKIVWASGKVPSGRIFAVKELPWSEENLRKALKDIAVHFPRKLRVVVGEEYSYLAEVQGEGDHIKKTEVQSVIPEELQENWDTRKTRQGFQLMAIQEKFLAILVKALSGENLKVEAVESESLALNREIGKKDDHLFFKGDGKFLLGAAKGGAVVFTRIFSKFPEEREIRNFLDYVSRRHGLVFSKIYADGETGAREDIFAKFGLTLEKKTLDPLSGMCRKKNIYGRDRDVLNIFLEKKDSGRKKDGSGGMSWREKILLAIFLAVIAGGGAAAYYIQKAKPGAKSPMPAIQERTVNQAGLDWGK